MDCKRRWAVVEGKRLIGDYHDMWTLSIIGSRTCYEIQQLCLIQCRNHL